MATHYVLKKNVLAMLMGASLLTACGGSNSKSTPVPTPAPAPDPTPIVEEYDYQALIDGAINDDVPGIILAIDGPDIEFLGAAGMSDLESQSPMQTDHVMPTGSAGKKATSFLVAILHQDNVLDVDDKISTWLPESILSQIEYSDQMTLRQLLNHTSGVYDYLDDATADAWFNTGFTDVATLKTDSYALEFALNQPASFEPGQGFDYSNTGYLLAGLILDEVLGEHHHKAMRSRILEPLAMDDTFYLGVEKHLGDIISGYLIDDGDITNTKPFYENVGVADAPLASTVTDLSTLIRTIMTDDNVSSDEIREMLVGEDSLTLVDAANQFYVGMGMFKNIRGEYTIYHHGGEEIGYKTSNIYIDELDTTVTAFFNCHGHTTCIEQTDDLIGEILNSLLED